MTVVAACLLVVGPAVPSARAEATLDAARWAHRLLVVSAPARDDPALRAQRDLLLGFEDAAAARDLVRVEIAADAARVHPAGVLPEPSVASLRAALRLPADRFVVVLVGKDGGVKLRVDEAVPACALLAAIDAMPMRRREAAAAGTPPAACP